MTLSGLSGGADRDRDLDDEDKDEIPILSVSEALRILPSDERGEKKHTDIILVRGMISSTRQVIKMIAGVYSKCPKCNKLKYKRLDKPVFVDKEIYDFEVACEEGSTLHDVKRDWDTNEIVYDKKGTMVYDKPPLEKWYEYRNASIIEVQDMDKFDDLERLPIILFDDDTRDVKAGEQVLVKGVIYIEKFTKMDYSLHSRLYSHSITYEARREISLSSQDIDAIKRFVSKHGNNIVDVLSRMFAPDVIGLYNIKKGLFLCAASCANDARKARQRMHALLIGEPGLAKSMLLRRITEPVPNSRCESAQNSSGKSMTAIVTKENGENTVLRLGPIPFAKEAIAGLNELGRMSFDDQAPLLDVMEEGEFTINKYGMNARIRSPTVIIGSANPTGSKWSNTGASDGRISLDDIPAIKPLIDRFDYVFVVKMSRDERVVMEYAQAKSKYEDRPAPNYNTYLEKHLIYAKRFNPKMSPEATHILNQFYSGVIKNMGSPRVRDTLFKTARMIARLKLKKTVDSNDAREACEFYNVILQEYDRAVFVPPDPMETAVSECIYTLEANVNPMIAEEMISKTCERVEYVRAFIGERYSLRNNKKARDMLDRILESSRVEKIQLKPMVLRIIRKAAPETET